jgi:[acyl-carrier-protein] S-malonyltransferase
MSTAFIFPGQGSQAPGMGKALADAHPEAAEVFATVDSALGEDLSKTLWQGSAEELTLTRIAQPGLMAVSLAAYRVLTTMIGALPQSVAYFAGHSLGEYSALAAADSIGLADIARLLRLRGEAMQRAVPAGEGAMAAIIGLDAEAVAALAAAAAGGEVCEVANDNGGGQIVISGHRAAVERAMAAAKEQGAKRAIPLQVSGPFHSTLMAPAAEEMRQALAAVDVKPPRVPVVANVTAMPHGDPDSIRQRLVEQITGTVRWRESVLWLAGEGVTRFVELGPGKVLAGLVRRIVPEAETVSAGTPEEIGALADMLA